MKFASSLVNAGIVRSQTNARVDVARVIVFTQISPVAGIYANFVVLTWIRIAWIVVSASVLSSTEVNAFLEFVAWIRCARLVVLA